MRKRPDFTRAIEINPNIASPILRLDGIYPRVARFEERRRLEECVEMTRTTPAPISVPENLPHTPSFADAKGFKGKIRIKPLLRRSAIFVLRVLYAAEKNG